VLTIAWYTLGGLAAAGMLNLLDLPAGAAPGEPEASKPVRQWSWPGANPR
jgi:hypothetical protein